MALFSCYELDWNAMSKEPSSFLGVLCIGMFIISFWCSVLATSVVLSDRHLQPPAPREWGDEWQPPQQTAYYEQSKTAAGSAIARSGKTSVTKRESGSTGAQGEAKEEPSKWSDPIVWFTAGLLFIGGVQVVIYYRQTTIMKQTLVIAQRPYVWTSVDKFSRFTEAIPPVFAIRLIHGGKNPAKDVEVRTLLFINPVGGLLPAINTPWQPRLGNLFPNDATPMIVNCEPRRFFSAQEIQYIRNKSHYVGIGVEVQYWDVFSQGHITRVYYAIDADSESLERLTNAEDGPCELHFVLRPGGSSFT